MKILKCEGKELIGNRLYFDFNKGVHMIKVPKIMQEKYDAVATIITDFCEEHLNDEYAALSLELLGKLCRKRPSPLLNGKPRTWACGIVYVIGVNNFLFDKTQSPYMRASELALKFGLSASTAGNKAGEINKIINIYRFDPAWTLPSRLGENPLVWMFETDKGFPFDVRRSPRELKEKLFNKGMIPFILADHDEAPKVADESKATPENNKITKAPQLAEGQLSLEDLT
jgi:hypothetical protein